MTNGLEFSFTLLWKDKRRHNMQIPNNIEILNFVMLSKSSTWKGLYEGDQGGDIYGRNLIYTFSIDYYVPDDVA